jgi:hypothetical protein
MSHASRKKERRSRTPAYQPIPPSATREAPKATLRDITTRSLSVRAGSIDEETRSVEAVLATESPVQVWDWKRWGLIDEVLRMDGIAPPEQVVLLESHHRYSTESVLGSIRSIRIDGTRLIGRPTLAEGDEAADGAWNKIRQGHITDISVGYRTDEYTDIKPNTTETVNGKRYTAGDRPLRITTRWTLKEGSLVPIGADEAAKIREQHTPPPLESKNMHTKLKQYLVALGLRTEADEGEAWEYYRGLQGEQAKFAKTLNESNTPERGAVEPTPSTAPAPPASPDTQGKRAEPEVQPVDIEAIRKEERERQDAIRKLAGDKVPAELVERAISEGWDTGKAALEFIPALAGTSERAEPVGAKGPAIHSRDHEADCTARALGAAMLQRTGCEPVDPKATQAEQAEQARHAEMGHQYRNMSMVDVCREAVRLDGGRTSFDRHEMIRAAVSGSTLLYVFSTSVNAQVLASYAEAGDTTAGLTRDVDVTNFMTQERIRIGQGGNLERLPRGDEAKHGKYADAKEEYKISRFAKKFVVDEQDIIDDRFDVLTDSPMQFGRAAARLRPDHFYNIILANAALGADGVALMHATHSNLLTTATLSAAKIQAAIVAMAKQQEDGLTLNIRPKYLLVPQDLSFNADIFLHSAERVVASTSGGTLNPLKNENIQTVSDNRLGVAGVTDPLTGAARAGSASTWYMLADPKDAPVIEIGYLAGTNRSPVVNSYVLTEGQWGIGWAVKMDIGAKALDYRGIVKNTA